MSKATGKAKHSITSIGAGLERTLAAYTAAAGAAGVGILTLTHPAEAKVVYTPTNTRISLSGAIPIDLNHDGIVDFDVTLASGYGGQAVWLNVAPHVTGNAVHDDINREAAAGFLGVPVGPGENFATHSQFGMGVFMAFMSLTALSTAAGPWANATNRYLGLKFLINGQTHFGWARLTVGKFLDYVVLTGYAYETEPNKNIIEGHISGASASNFAQLEMPAPPQPGATLGMLARGTDGMVLWRREEERREEEAVN